jgi:hypothetical protein
VSPPSTTFVAARYIRPAALAESARASAAGRAEPRIML